MNQIASTAPAHVHAAPTSPGEGPWAAGFYVLEAALESNTGAPRQLRLLTGVDEAGRPHWQPLAPTDAQGCLRSIVVLAGSVDRLEVQSDDGGPVPPLASLRLHPVGRAQALREMLLNLRVDGSRPRWRLIPGTVTAALMAAARFNLRTAGDVVVQRYLYGLRSPAQRRSVPARVRVHAWLPVNAQLTPVSQLQPARQDDGRTAWVATGSDPQFQLTQAGGPCQLAAGWYHLRMRLRPLAGRVAAPCMYPDFGNGARQDGTVSLPEPDVDGWVRTLILFRSPVARLRLDPTIAEARFLLEDVEVRRVGRVRALLSMLSVMRMPNGLPDWKAIAAASLAFIRTTASAGVSEAANSLFRLYQDLQSPRSYGEWVRRYDSHTPAAPAGQAESPVRPLISILLPVYQTPERWLRCCLDSVLRQTYPHWELCIADDASPSERVREVLREYERRDPRIRVAYRAQNGHISEASNSALALARGEFVGLLDHDDELRPHALAEMVHAIATHPAAQLLYSDEDKIDGDGRRFQPYFKPDWNPDLLRSQNYICHFTMIGTALVREVGGFRTGFEGSQDHDLILRCAERLDGTQIHHVPKVLYHWRAIKGSTALERDAKDYAGQAGLRAVAEHLDRTATGARAESLEHGHYRVRWPVPDPAPRVSLIVPTRDRVELLRTCVESVLERTRYPNYELLVIDNQSRDPEALEYLESLRGRASVRVLSYDAPFNYSAINNWAVAGSEGALVGLLNNDVEVICADWLDEMVGHALRPEVGAVGAMLYYPDDTIQHAGVILGLGGVANHAYAGQHRGYPGHGARALVAQNLSSVTGACLLLRREVFDRVGGLDERLKVAFNDVDLCLRLCEAGYRNVWTPFAELYHHESASRGREDSPEKLQRFLGEVSFMETRWGDRLQRDPAYNPNLSLDSVNSEFAFPPRDP